MNRLFASAALALFLYTNNVAAVMEKNQMKMKLDATPVIPGNYLESCTCLPVNSTAVLSCQCFDASGNLNSMTELQNAWACENFIDNNNGVLVCDLPLSSDTDGYQAVCSGCAISFNNLWCYSCEGTGPYVVSVLDSCESVSFTAAQGLFCIGGTPAPTQSTNSPTEHPTNMPFTTNTKTPTKKPSTTSPTPNAAPPDCESYWLNINGNGVEAAPWKPCSTGLFTTSNGCQYQNYCCWQTTGANNAGICTVPTGVDFDCPTLTTQAACLQGYPYCSWDASYNAPTGLCRRNCAGNPQAMCAV